MKIRKLCGTVAVAISMFALSATASADHGDIHCDDLITGIEDLASELRCKPDGYWPNDNAIWQWKGKGTMGCAVHEKLAKLLYEKRTGDEPPPIKKGKNFAKGAANDLRDGKNQPAYDQLTLFIERIMYEAKLNRGFLPKNGAQKEADEFVRQADLARACIVLP